MGLAALSCTIIANLLVEYHAVTAGGRAVSDSDK